MPPWLRRASALSSGEERLTSGIDELDRVLPGLAPGSLLELLADEGVGAFELALRIAAHRQSRRPWRCSALVDPAGDFYPPAAARAGIALERFLIIRPSEEEVLSCLDEVLRSKAVAVAVARLGKRNELDGAESQKLAFAARCGGGIGVIVQTREAKTSVSLAAVRLIVRAESSGLVLEPLRVRGALSSGPWRIS